MLFLSSAVLVPCEPLLCRGGKCGLADTAVFYHIQFFGGCIASKLLALDVNKLHAKLQIILFSIPYSLCSFKMIIGSTMEQNRGRRYLIFKSIFACKWAFAKNTFDVNFQILSSNVPNTLRIWHIVIHSLPRALFLTRYFMSPSFINQHGEGQCM